MPTVWRRWYRSRQNTLNIWNSRTASLAGEHTSILCGILLLSAIPTSGFHRCRKKQKSNWERRNLFCLTPRLTGRERYTDMFPN